MIEYTYLLLEKDRVRKTFVEEIIQENKYINCCKALDGSCDSDYLEVLDILKHREIGIHDSWNPEKEEDDNKKRFLKNKLSLYGSYIRLLEYYKNKSEFTVVIQDDTMFNDQCRMLAENISNNLPKNKSARLGQYMSCCIFGNELIDRLIENLQRTKVIQPLDHYLIGLEAHFYHNSKFYEQYPLDKMMIRQPENSPVVVKNFKSNIVV